MSRPAFSLSALGRENSFVTGKNAIKNKHTCLTQSGLTAELSIKPISFLIVFAYAPVIAVSDGFGAHFVFYN